MKLGLMLLCRDIVVRRRVLTTVTVLAICIPISVYVYVDTEAASVSVVADDTTPSPSEVKQHVARKTGRTEWTKGHVTKRRGTEGH